jgi:hypothetical protein
MEYHTRLVATFTNEASINQTIEFIKKNLTVENNRLYVYKDLSELDKLLLTYNILLPKNSNKESFPVSKKVKSTIFIHRRRETNTLYTIDGLNEAIKTINEGILDIKFIVDWKQFENRLLLEKNGALNSIPIEFCRLHDLTKLKQ